MDVPGDTMSVSGVAMSVPVGWRSVGASPRVSRGGEASGGLYHMSSDGDERKFLGGGTSAWASSREPKGSGARGWASPWMSQW